MIRAASLAVCAALTGPLFAQSAPPVDALPFNALPFNVGGPYALINQHGAPHTQADPDGHAQLLFFGYANCPGICTAALPMMADLTELLANAGIPIRPVMITVDPARDTVENMNDPLTNYHDDFIGLTGDQTALDAAYKAFSVDHSLAYDDPHYGPVYTHGSLIYLLDGTGKVLTLIPPVMDARTASDVALKYLTPAG